LTLVAILALVLALALVWRLVRFAVKLLLLGALIALIAGYGTRATTRHAPTAPAHAPPTSQQPRPSGAPRAPGRQRRSRAMFKRPEQEPR
jgi:hypothetical protein